ncbi:MAG: M4 family metallopeptidase, partial [Roseiflexaceae bacterium]
MKPQLLFRRLIGPIALLLLIGHALAPQPFPLAPEQALDFAAGRAAAQATGAPVCGNSFTAAADTFVNQGAPTNNYGLSSQLVVGRGSRGEERTLLAFNILPVLPQGATIHKAELELRLAGTPTPVPFKMEVREAAGAWGETTVNWNNQPALGARYGAVSYTPSSGVVRIDVTALVTRWHTGVISNTGLVLLPAADSTNVTFSSRESTIAPNIAPKLIVSCATPDEAVARSQAQADQKQTAGLALLRQRSSKPATLQVRRGALDFAEFDLTIPENIGNDVLAKAQWFLGTHKDALRLTNPATELQLTRRSRDGQHLFFRQRHNGIPVFPATLGVHLDGSHVRGLGGNYVPDITTPSTPRLTARQAESLAGAQFGDGSVRLGDGSVKLGDGSVRPSITGQTQLRYLNMGLLGDADTNTYLTWQVHVNGPDGLVTLFVDAFSGVVRFKQSHTMEDLDLDIETGNHDTSISCWILTTSDDQWFDEDGVVSGASPDAEGYSTFNSAKTVYNYWNNRFGHDSYDDDGEDIEMYIHVGQNWKNAHYSSGCDIFEFGDGFPVLDVVAHEFTHGVTHNFADLIYENQAGALNESFSDIFGYFVDSDDWTMGEDMPGGALRDLSNPPAFGQPDHMQAAKSGDGKGLRKLPSGTDPECDSSDPNYNDCGFVHTNSGIHNKAAYLIINGGTHNGFTVQGIGKTKAERLFYNMLTYRLWDSAQFIDARNAAVA